MSIQFDFERKTERSFFFSKTGVLPPYRDAHEFVIQQRHEHFNDLKHTVEVMKKTCDEDDAAFQLSMMYLLDEGALRFVKIPKVRHLLHILSIFQSYLQIAKNSFTKLLYLKHSSHQK